MRLTSHFSGKIFEIFFQIWFIDKRKCSVNPNPLPNTLISVSGKTSLLRLNTTSEQKWPLRQPLILLVSIVVSKELSDVPPTDFCVLATIVKLPEVLIIPAVDVLMEGGLIISEELSPLCNELSISNKHKSESCKMSLASSLLFNKVSSDLLSMPVIFLLSKKSMVIACSDVEDTYWTSRGILLSFPEK